MKFFKHLFTITKHRFVVMKHCFKVGLIWRGLWHDMSKYSPAEFFAGVKYYQGNRSPQAKEREVKGYSAAWLHHKGRNEHHFEYWKDGKKFVEMPAIYFGEMVCDRIAASKIYLKDEYTDSAPLEYFLNKTDRCAMHEKTAEKLEYFLTMLAEKGEKETFRQLKKYIKDNR